MKKFMVISGFLGAGKTSAMIEIHKCLNNGMKIKATAIANDLGAKDLVDTMFTKKNGCSITELTGDCICYQTENLVDRLRRLFDYEHCEFVMSDIPGCGVGALDHVYHKLSNEYPGEFELAPFTVVTDPERLRMIMPEDANINLPEEMKYLFKAQLMETDVVVLNKIDTLSEENLNKTSEFLRDFCPDVPLFLISAKEGTGIKELTKYLLANSAELKKVDIGYGEDEFMAAESKLSWYDRQYYARVCCNDFNGNEYIKDLMNGIRKGLKETGGNVPHLKVFAESQDKEFAKMSLTGVDYDIQCDKEFENPCVDMSVVINVRVAYDAAEFAKLVDEVMMDTAKKYQLEIMVFFTEGFGMMDQGRI